MHPVSTQVLGYRSTKRGGQRSNNRSRPIQKELLRYTRPDLATRTQSVQVWMKSAFVRRVAPLFMKQSALCLVGNS